MLTNMNKILEQAKQQKVAIAQFNINNLEWTKYILETCEKLNKPVILGVSESAINYIGGVTTVVNIVVGLMIDLKIKIPVVIHLDHGQTYEICKDAIDAGFTSVMIDASKLSLDKNIELTSKVVEYAHKYNVSVEGELGTIDGTEDNITNDESIPSLLDCLNYIASTGIDAFAPSLGNKHGIYTNQPNLNLELLKNLQKETNIPLVLHGGSGIEKATITNLISLGITKININTELQIEWSKGIRNYLKNNETEYDPRKIISSGKNLIENKITDLISTFNKNY